MFFKLIQLFQSINMVFTDSVSCFYDTKKYIYPGRSLIVYKAIKSRNLLCTFTSTKPFLIISHQKYIFIDSSVFNIAASNNDIIIITYLRKPGLNLWQPCFFFLSPHNQKEYQRCCFYCKSVIKTLKS